ncbi:MAG TPA: hypothetical protein DEQ26_04550 [Flavobacteriaceae bacterium]|nr:hypothetical protein [Flavobacteriaceae bacterium]
MKYNLAFTAGALLYNESSLYLSAINNIEAYCNGDENVDIDVLTTNSESSRKRIKSELDKRFKNINFSYLEKFNQVDEQDQKIILFFAICNTYQIITEFSLEVVYKKWLNFDNELGTYDFKYFLSSKLSEDQLNDISSSSQYKLTQVAIKIFKDVGLYKNESLIPLKPSEDLIDLIYRNGDQWFFNCILFNNQEEI